MQLTYNSVKYVQYFRITRKFLKEKSFDRIKKQLFITRQVPEANRCFGVCECWRDSQQQNALKMH